MLNGMGKSVLAMNNSLRASVTRNSLLAAMDISRRELYFT